MHSTEPIGTQFAHEHAEGEFAQAVGDDLRGDKALQEILSVGELLPYWEDELVRLKQELECQLSERDATLAETKLTAKDDAWRVAESGYKRWRTSVLRLRYCVEARLRFVKQLRRRQHEDRNLKLGKRVAVLERQVATLLEGTEECRPTGSLESAS